MLEENKPETEYRLVVVKRSGDRGRTVRLRVCIREDHEATLKTWDWVGGLPSAGDLEDLAVTVAREISAGLTARYGVQGVLLG